MKTLVIAAVSAFALSGLAACGESAADRNAEVQADQLEAQAAATPNEQEEKNLNAQADHVEQQAGNVDGGMTTENTPSTSPTAGEQPGM